MVTGAVDRRAWRMRTCCASCGLASRFVWAGVALRVGWRRASHVPRHRERRGGRGLVSPACGHLKSGLDGRDFLGRSMKTHPRNASGPRPAPSYTCHRCPRRGATACETSPRPPRRATVSADGEKHALFLNVVLASTGHRGRVDTRGRRSGGASGLTRTLDRGAGTPSRDGRSAAPSAPWLACSPASVDGVARVGGLASPRQAVAQRSCQAARGRRRRASSNTRRSADILTRCSRQARRPASRLAAGIDAASMARRCQKQL